MKVVVIKMSCLITCWWKKEIYLSTWTSKQGKKLPNSLVHAGHKSGAEGREETASMMRAPLHRGATCGYAGNKNVTNQSEVSNLQRLWLLQVAYFWLVDDVLIVARARVVACLFSMEKGPKSDDTTPTAWSRSRPYQRQNCQFWTHAF